jgi:hypothetical protein
MVVRHRARTSTAWRRVRCEYIAISQTERSRAACTGGRELEYSLTDNLHVPGKFYWTWPPHVVRSSLYTATLILGSNCGAASIRHRFFCLGIACYTHQPRTWLSFFRFPSFKHQFSRLERVQLGFNSRYKTDKGSNPLFALMDRSFLAVPQFRRNLPVSWFNSMVPRGGRAETS